MSLHYSPNIVSSGLVLCLDAGDPRSYPGSGTVWADRSGLGNNGTLLNSVGYNSSNRGNLVFDGVDDFTTMGRVPIVAESGLLSYSIWFKTSDTTKTQQVLCVTNWSNMIQYNGGVSFTWWANINITGVTFNVPAIVQNQWYNITVSQNNSLLSVYLNGVSVYSTTGVTNILNANDIRNHVGSFGTAGRFFKGSIAQVLVYGKNLTAAEAQQNFEATRSRYGI